MHGIPTVGHRSWRRWALQHIQADESQRGAGSLQRHANQKNRWHIYKQVSRDETQGHWEEDVKFILLCSFGIWNLLKAQDT